MFSFFSQSPIEFYRRVLAEGLEQKLNVGQNLSITSFLSGLKAISPNLFSFRAYDTDHKLACELILETKESYLHFYSPSNHHLMPVVTCDYPCIDIPHQTQSRNETLESLKLIWFQLHILEQLFLLCESNGVGHLILNFGEYNYDYIEVYQDFAVSQRQLITSQGEQTELVIPTTEKVYDKVINLMDEIEQDFRQILRNNPQNKHVFQEYLKCHSF